MLQSARVVFFILLSILAGCASNGIKGDTLSHQQILIQSGEKLGVDLTSPLFAKQTKCYVEPFKLFENPKVWFRSICYQDGTIVTDLFSVRKGVSLQSFVSENVEVIAKDRARNGYTNTDHKSVQFLEEHNGVSYHSIKIGRQLFSCSSHDNC
jgi:hypothetical protein